MSADPNNHTKEPDMNSTEHQTTVTGGVTATCTCGWTRTWSTADGSAHEDASAHARRFAA